MMILLALWLLSCGGASQPATPEGDAADTTTAMLSKVMVTPPRPEVPVAYLLGKFDPDQDSLMVAIQDVHSAGSGRGAYLHREAYAAFVRMYEAARDSGITLTIRSATRNFYRQKEIWEAKWTGARIVEGKNLAQAVADPEERARIILRFSSMPGTSRHHWGTDMDLNAFENSYFESGQGLKEYQWLRAHAAEYGFCQPYSAKGPQRPHGYEMEKWHWSYLPVADGYLKAYEATIIPEMIEGFQGAEVASSLQVIEHYVLGISQACVTASPGQ